MTTQRSLNSRYTAEQQQFLASIAGRSPSQMTDADHANAARVGMTLVRYPAIVRERQPWGVGTKKSW